MKTIRVRASGEYDILIGEGLLKELGVRVREQCGPVRALLVTDDTVAALYLNRALDVLKKVGIGAVPFVFPAGEASKCADTWLRLLNFMASVPLDRSDAVIALGGGVTGDLAGFAAATYLRGVPLVQVPTTLLAAVDSSVGGKTAIDLDAGKNLAGAFYQPKLVLCDTSLLKTLPERIFADGCAEVIKYGMIRDPALLAAVTETSAAETAEEVVARCVSIKRDVVQKDEFDRGDRQLLNFGHTFGHAVELQSGFAISHGSAVAIGMAMVTRATVRFGICGEECLAALTRALKKYGLPDRTGLPAEKLAETVLRDKKRTGETLRLIVPEAVGRCVIRPIPISDVPDWIGKGLA